MLLNDLSVSNYNGYGDESLSISPLHLAAYKGHKKAVMTLAAISSDVNVSDSSGRTPLDLSAQFGHLECLNALMEYGAQPVAQPVTLLTAIHRAAVNGHFACLQQLLDRYKSSMISILYSTYLNRMSNETIGI